MKKMLMFKTPEGVELFFNEENNKFSSNSSKEEIIKTLYKAFNNFDKDLKTAQCAMNLIGAIKFYGWEEE